MRLPLIHITQNTRGKPFSDEEKETIKNFI